MVQPTTHLGYMAQLRLQHVTVLNTVDNCTTMVFVNLNISKYRKVRKYSIKDQVCAYICAYSTISGNLTYYK